MNSTPYQAYMALAKQAADDQERHVHDYHGAVEGVSTAIGGVSGFAAGHAAGDYMHGRKMVEYSGNVMNHVKGVLGNAVLGQFSPGDIGHTATLAGEAAKHWVRSPMWRYGAATAGGIGGAALGYLTGRKLKKWKEQWDD